MFTIYGELNKQLENIPIYYTGINSNSIILAIDNENRTIKADVNVDYLYAYISNYLRNPFKTIHINSINSSNISSDKATIDTLTTTSITTDSMLIKETLLLQGNYASQRVKLDYNVVNALINDTVELTFDPSTLQITGEYDNALFDSLVDYPNKSIILKPTTGDNKYTLRQIAFIPGSAASVINPGSSTTLEYSSSKDDENAYIHLLITRNRNTDDAMVFTLKEIVDTKQSIEMNPTISSDATVMTGIKVDDIVYKLPEQQEVKSANGISVDSDGYLQLDIDGTAIADQPKNVQPLAIQALVDASKKYIHINAPQYDGNEDYLNEVVAQFTRSLQYALGDDVDVNNIYYSFVPHVMTNYGIVTLDANINMTTEQNDTTGIIFGGRKSFLYKDNMMGFKDENNKQIYIDFSDIPETLEAGSGLYFAKMAIADVYGHVITQTPTEDNHAANKKYVEDILSLGLDNKLNKVVTTSVLSAYTTKGNTQGTISIAQDIPSNSSLSQYTADGTLRTYTPKDNNDCTNKKYVDDALEGKLDKVTLSGGSDKVYVATAQGTQTTVSYSSGIQNYAIVSRTSTGQINTATPTEDNHAANKKYVDDRTLQMKVMTQSEYDGLTTKDENTMYIIIG